MSILSVSPSVASSGQTWMEVAYGTQSGRVVVVVRHPENIGQAPQVFQSYHVHTCAILRVVLGEKHLISGMYVVDCPNLWTSIASSCNYWKGRVILVRGKH